MNLDLYAIAQQFQPEHKILTVTPLGSGNINHTFQVCCGETGRDRFILQRINQQVFPNPPAIMQNLQVLCRHRQQKQQQFAHWQIPQVLCTRSGLPYYRDLQGICWRALQFIDGQTVEVIATAQQAEEMGRGLATFHLLLSDLDAEMLVDTLPGFHITPNYLHQYDQIALHNGVSESPLVPYVHQAIRDRRLLAGILETAKQRGELPLRVIHGDPKVNNMMLDPGTGRAIALIDLDTLKPGLIHYDIGDCLRSACNPLGEETTDWDRVYFDLEKCKSFLIGYLEVARSFFTPADYLYIYDAIRVITFELGLRFFSDFLAGNRYFKVQDAEHNLRRAVVQFRLLENIEAQKTAIQALIDQCR